MKTGSKIFRSPNFINTAAELEDLLVDRADLEVIEFQKGRSLNNEAAIALGRIMQTLTMLKELLIEGGLLRPESMHAIAVNLHHTRLEKISFFDIRTDSRTIQELIRYLTDVRSNLRILELNRCSLGDLEVRLLADVIPRLSRLEKLDLMENNITDVGARALLAAISIHTHSKPLAYLDIQLNPEISDGVKRMFIGLLKAGKIHTLTVY